MSQDITQSVATALYTTLTNSSNVPVTGLIFSDVTCKYAKYGDSGLTTKTLTNINFLEIGAGVYTITFTTTELNTIGAFVWIVTGASIQQSYNLANIEVAANATSPIVTQTCVISGYVVNAKGAPVVDTVIYARPLGSPTIQTSFGISTNFEQAKTNSYGQFFLELVRLLDVEIFIPEINYRRQLTVPNSASADLFTGIP